MTILYYKATTTGMVGVTPQFSYIHCDNTLSEVTTAGFLNPNTVDAFYPDNMFLIRYATDINLFQASVSNGVVTFSTATADVALPTLENYIAVWSNTKGGLKVPDAAVRVGESIMASLSDAASGNFIGFSPTTDKGSLSLKAADNTGNTDTAITNAEMGQASVITIPDPGAATANFNISAAALVNNNLVKASGTAGKTADAGYRLIANTTAAYAGGGTSNAYAATGLTVNSKGSAVIRASTNAVSICKALPGTDTLTITFSADPGADTTVDYIYSTAAAA